MSLSALIGGARYPLAEEIESCIRQDRQAKCIQNLTVIIFCWSRDTVLLCAKREYLQTHIYAFTTRIVARLTATSAILSRMCRQVWIGTFGICRLHARAPIPMQTNTLGISRCTDRHIRHMQTSAPTDSTYLRLSPPFKIANAGILCTKISDNLRWFLGLKYLTCRVPQRCINTKAALRFSISWFHMISRDPPFLSGASIFPFILYVHLHWWWFFEQKSQRKTIRAFHSISHTFMGIP